MFSDAKVVERVKKEFVPVALKAVLVNGPPKGAEGRLYAEVGRSKVAPQGICAVNADGRVLAWTMMFEGKDALQKFLDHVLALNEKHPAGSEAFPAERYMKFPGDRLDDVEGEETGIPPKAHKDGERCPAALGVEKGTLVGTMYGRTFQDCKPTGDPARQERYLESRVEIRPDAQRALADAADAAGGEQFDVPASAAAALCGQAFLGQLDVNPTLSPGAETSWKLRGQVEVLEKESWVRIQGTTSAKSDESRKSDRAVWSNDVRLTWNGLARLEGRSVTKLILTAEGRQKLTWNHGDRDLDPGSALENLPGGRQIRLDSDVKFGVVAEVAKSDEVGPGISPRGFGLPKSLVEKMERLKAAMDDERTPTIKRQRVARMMEAFESLAKNEEFEAAEAVIDVALKAVK
ncbi:MAG: hypothetical protein AAB074_22220 [Planctomycetota bacterium]